MKDYCSIVDREINIDKTKVMTFSRRKLRKPHYFNYVDQNIEVINEYNSLGLVFNYKSKFNIAKNSLYQKGLKAMFSLLKKYENVITFRCSYKALNNLVPPAVLYGAEVWGCESFRKITTEIL